MQPTLLSIQVVAASILLPMVAATGGDDCCNITLSSPACFTDPAGQLPDGQIRFNGSYPTSTFCLSKDGGLTDQNGFGCIVTDAPTTQVQCDSGKAPTKGFSISAEGNNTLLYNNSSSFFACPATDTEWNIYVSPDFGQTKCFPLTLTASSGCGASASPSPSTCPAASATTSTVWLTQWSTETISVTVNTTVTSDCSCPATSTSTSSPTSTWGNTTTTACARCTKFANSTLSTVGTHSATGGHVSSTAVL